jgi:hypothetical protein
MLPRRTRRPRPSPHTLLRTRSRSVRGRVRYTLFALAWVGPGQLVSWSGDTSAGGLFPACPRRRRSHPSRSNKLGRRLAVLTRFPCWPAFTRHPRLPDLAVFTWTHPSGMYANGASAITRAGLRVSLSGACPPLAVRLVLNIGRLVFLFSGQLARGQASLLERAHLLQQGLLQILRHSLPFRTSCANSRSTLGPQSYSVAVSRGSHSPNRRP